MISKQGVLFIMDIKETTEIYRHLKASKLNGLVDSLIKSAVRYARIRTDWYLSSTEVRAEMDAERTAAHNAFISHCDILARNMQKAGEDNSWRYKIGGNDRKQIGDFACSLHAVMGILAR